MAEFCKECAKNVLKMSDKQLANAVWSRDTDLCEGCGKRKPVLVSLEPQTIVEQFAQFFGF